MIDEMDDMEPTLGSHHRQPRRLDAHMSHGLGGFMPSGQKVLNRLRYFRRGGVLNTGGFNHPTHDFFLLEFLQQNTNVEYKVDSISKMGAESDEGSL